MKLLPHQKKAVEEWCKRCSKGYPLKGMLMFHKMGTGKTFTATACYNRFGAPVQLLVVCPLHLVQMWEAFLSKNVPSKKKSPRPRVITYGSMDEDSCRGSFVVLDECHLMDETHASMVSSCTRCVLLTGTPIRRSIVDMRLYANVCSVELAMPWNPSDFDAKYAIRMTPEDRRLYHIVLPTMSALVSSVSGRVMDLASATTRILPVGAVFDSMRSFGKFLSGDRGNNPVHTAAVVLTQICVNNIVVSWMNARIRKGTKVRYDIRRIIEDSSSFMSYVDGTEEGIDAPDITRRYEVVRMTPLQEDILLRLSFKPLVVSKLIKSANLSKEDRTGIVSREVLNREGFVRWGRSIGSAGPNPPKIEGLKAAVRETLLGGSYGKVAVYSCFEGSCDLLVRSLTGASGLRNSKDVEAFNSDPSSRVAVLYPRLREGIGLKDVVQMHLFEPQEGYHTTEQVVHRIARHGSHSEGSPGVVDVVTWVSSLEKDSTLEMVANSITKNYWNAIRQMAARSGFYGIGAVMDLVPTEWTSFARYREDLDDHSALTFSDTKTFGSDVCPDMECAWACESVAGDVRALEEVLGEASKLRGVL